MLNSAYFNTGELKTNCCKIARVFHLLLNFHKKKIFSKLHCSWLVCANYLKSTRRCSWVDYTERALMRNPYRNAQWAHVETASAQTRPFHSRAYFRLQTHAAVSTPAPKSFLTDGMRDFQNSPFWDSLSWNYS